MCVVLLLSHHSALGKTPPGLIHKGQYLALWACLSSCCKTTKMVNLGTCWPCTASWRSVTVKRQSTPMTSWVCFRSGCYIRNALDLYSWGEPLRNTSCTLSLSGTKPGSYTPSTAHRFCRRHGFSLLELF